MKYMPASLFGYFLMTRSHNDYRFRIGPGDSFGVYNDTGI